MASNKKERKKLVCEISVDDPVTSESESELDDDVLDEEFNLEFSGHLTLHHDEDQLNNRPHRRGLFTS